MSKYINVNPDHYKLRGRERPGKGIVPKEHPKTTEEIEQERWKEKICAKANAKAKADK